MADKILPFAPRLLSTSRMRLAAGDLKGGLAALLRCEATFEGEVPSEVFSQATSILIDLRDWSEATKYARKAHAAQPDDPVMIYVLGSLLAYQGELGVADDLFSRDVPIYTGNGLVTYSRALRFTAGVERSPIVVQGMQTIKDAPGTFSSVYLVAADSMYFSRYATALARSMSIHGCGILLHFHVVNPDENTDRIVRSLDRAYSSVRVSTETVDLSSLDEWQRRTYYACARYRILPEICGQHSTQVVVADIDQVLVAPIDALFKVADGKDVCLLKFDNQQHNLLSLISATLLVVGATEASLEFVHDLANRVDSAVKDPNNLVWHADQASLAVTYLTKRDVDYGTIPPYLVYLGEGEPPDAGPSIFWSITNSVPENLSKLEASSFVRLAHS